MVACIMADTLQRRLQAYITDYRTQKTRIDLAYYKKLTDESKANYEKARREYAKFCDSNFDIELETFKSRRDQLENEMQMQYNVYSQMATQLQNAKAKVQENTPAFTMIQSPVMPYKASSRPRVFTVIIFIFLSFILYLTRFAPMMKPSHTHYGQIISLPPKTVKQISNGIFHSIYHIVDFVCVMCICI